jgi:Family of unknown function (DUF6172)
MKKTFPLHIEGKNNDRVVEAVKHELRKYIKRERRRDLPKEVDFWDFDCKFGLTQEAAEPVHLATLTGHIDAAVVGNATQFYVEILAKHGHRKARAPGERDVLQDELADPLG